MAKTLGSTTRMCQLQWDGTNKTLRFVSYEEPVDDTDPERIYRKTGTPLASPAPRALTAGELSGTLQAFLDGCDAEINTAEGIV